MWSPTSQVEHVGKVSLTMLFPALMLNDIAEMVVGHEDGGADDAARAHRVSAAKARLKSGKSDLARKLVLKRSGK